MDGRLAARLLAEGARLTAIAPGMARHSGGQGVSCRSPGRWSGRGGGGSRVVRCRVGDVRAVAAVGGAGRGRGRWRVHRQVPGRHRVRVPYRCALAGPARAVRSARWATGGTFDRLPAAARTGGEVDRRVAIGSTIVRAHQHAAAEGARRTGSRALARRADRQGSPDLRRTRPAAGLCADRGRPRRPHTGRDRHRPVRSAVRPRPAPSPGREPAGRRRPGRGGPDRWGGARRHSGQVPVGSMAWLTRWPMARRVRCWAWVSGSKTRRRTSSTWPGAVATTFSRPAAVRTAKV